VHRIDGFSSRRKTGTALLSLSNESRKLLRRVDIEIIPKAGMIDFLSGNLKWRASMSKTWKVGIFVLAACLAVAVATLPSYGQRERTRRSEEGRGAHYSVVMTEGHNLLVTDNANNTLYFYTIDKDKPIGSPLKLRASVDLSKVGEDEIRINAHNLEKP
jgi:hypothetical protein